MTTLKSTQIWLNLAVSDVAVARTFYRSIGFKLNPQYGNRDDSASFLIGEHDIVLMLFTEATFSGFINREVADLTRGSEVLFSLSAEDHAHVDAMAELVEAAGGSVFAQPESHQGWMYGMGFADPDGHRWNLLYMDLGDMPTDS